MGYVLYALIVVGVYTEAIPLEHAMVLYFVITVSRILLFSKG